MPPYSSTLVRAHRTRVGVQIRGVQRRTGDGQGDGDAERPGAAAQVDDDGVLSGQRDRLVDECIAAVPGNEDPRSHDDVDAVELRPAQHLLQRRTRLARGDHAVEIGVRGRVGDEQSSLVLGEHAAGGPQASHHVTRHHQVPSDPVTVTTGRVRMAP